MTTHALPRGLDKEIVRIVGPALDRGWTAKPTASGHLLLRHPNGATAMAPSKRGSYRNIRNLAADIRRAEREGEDMVAQTIEEVPEVVGGDDRREWEPGTSNKGRFDRRPDGGGGYEYRCTVCGLELPGWQQAGWHWRREHSEPAPATAEPAVSVVPEYAAGDVPAAAAAPERAGVSPLAQAVADLVDRQVGDMHRENNTLRAENQRLRDTLAALASLAAEA